MPRNSINISCRRNPELVIEFIKDLEPTKKLFIDFFEECDLDDFYYSFPRIAQAIIDRKKPFEITLNISRMHNKDIARMTSSYSYYDTFQEYLLDLIKKMPLEHLDGLRIVCPEEQDGMPDMTPIIAAAIEKRYAPAEEKFAIAFRETSKKLPLPLVALVLNYFSQPIKSLTGNRLDFLLQTLPAKEAAINKFVEFIARFDTRKHQKRHDTVHKIFHQRHKESKYKKEAAQKCIDLLAGEQTEFSEDHIKALKEGKLKICFDEQAKKFPELLRAIENPSAKLKW